jgi:hypothetical protein
MVFRTYSNGLFEIYITGELNNFTFMFEVKNTWTQHKLYTEIASFISKTNLNYYIGTSSYDIYYGTTKLSSTTYTQLQKISGYSFDYPEFTIVVA